MPLALVFAGLLGAAWNATMIVGNGADDATHIISALTGLIVAVTGLVVALRAARKTDRNTKRLDVIEQATELTDDADEAAP